jgi:hypothetical protein
LAVGPEGILPASRMDSTGGEPAEENSNRARRPVAPQAGCLCSVRLAGLSRAFELPDVAGTKGAVTYMLPAAIREFPPAIRRFPADS